MSDRSNRPKSKGLVIHQGSTVPAMMRAQFRYIDKHRFVLTPQGWLCSRCFKRPRYNLPVCAGHTH